MKNFNNYIKENIWGTGKNNDFDGTYVENLKDDYKFLGYDIIDFEEIADSVEEIDKNDIQKYITTQTIKRMFPIYNELLFSKDWSTHVYKYQNYIFIYKSGYYYTFEKK